MKKWFSKFFAEMHPQSRNAFLMAMITVVGVSFTDIYVFYLIARIDDWQVVALAGALSFFVFIAALSAILARRKYPASVSALVLFGGFSIMALVSSVILAGVGRIILAASIILITTGAGLTLSRKMAPPTIITGIVVGIIALLIDFFVPAYQLAVPEAYNLFVATLFIVAIFFVLQIIRQFQTYTLRTKLLIGLEVAAFLSIGMVAVVSTVFTSKSLNDQIGASLQSISKNAASQAGDLIDKHRNQLNLLAINKLIQDGVETANESGALDSNEITALDTQWKNANDSDPLIRQVLENELAVELREYQSNFPQNVEVFITNQHGAIVASTGRTSDYYQADEEWWQSAWNNGQGSLYVSQPAFDESSNTYSINIALPIPAHNRKDFVGIIRTTVNIQEFSVILSANKFGQTGYTDLVFNDNLYLAENLQEPTGTLDAETIANLATLQGVYGQFNYEGSASLVSSAPVSSVSSKDAAVIKNLGWTIIIHQDLSEAQQPVTTSTRTITLLTIVVLAAAGALAFYMGGLFTKPIENLTHVAVRISQGDLNLQAQVESKDEIGALAGAFNHMTTQLREFIGTLEQRVADRTKALATSAEISRRLSTILNQKELVTEVVNQVKTAFGYYHTQIYFYDEANENLLMAGGTGEAGEKMLAQFHKIQKGRGLVGRAGESNQAVLVSDTSQNPEWLPNPLLPETKSEVAIPISIGERVLGVLDAQHNITNGLQQEDVDLLQSIANQVAVAIQNIRQYENAQKLASDLGVVANVGIATSTITEAGQLLQEVVDLSKKSFNLYHTHIYLLNEEEDLLKLASGAGEVGRQMVSEKRAIPMDSEKSLVARAARTREGVVVNDVTAAPDFLPHPLLPDTRSEMAVPMIVAGKVVGVLDVQSETANRFTEVDVSIQTTLASQVAVALQNARSFSQSQRQADRETAVNLITQKIQNTTSIEAALQIAARELGHALGMKPTLVTLDPESLAGERKDRQ